MRWLAAVVCCAAAFGADLTVAIRASGSPTAAAVRLYDSRGRLWIPGNALDLGLSVTAERSFWITALCETNREPLMDAPGFFSGGVSTPVYVEVDGAPCLATERLQALVAAHLRSLDAIEQALFSSGAVTGAPGAWESDEALRASTAAVRAQAARARKYYLNLQEGTNGKSNGTPRHCLGPRDVRVHRAEPLHRRHRRLPG